MRFQPLLFVSALSLLALASGGVSTSVSASPTPFLSANSKQEAPDEAPLTDEIPSEDEVLIEDGTPLVIEGALEPGDNVLASDGSLYDEHTFEGITGQSTTISLESPDFDTYLFLIGPDGDVVAENDDVSSDDLNSELTVTLEADGVYTIVTNGFDAQSQGSYTLTMTTAP